ncbi:MAG: DUF1775 domain-containing protein [Chloroflexi bacterium]|nr:DUF1775 domain-containing protein [Chloroflexota bacterium]
MVLAHVEVVPAESGAGETQRYGIRVPSEKPVATIRVEVQFPSTVRVLDFENSAGWQLTFQTDAAGRPVDALWTDGSIAPNQFAEFGLRVRNPDSEADLQWTVIQTYQDGTEVQWVGPPAAEFPAATSRIRRREVLAWPEVGAGVALVLSIVASIISVLAWRATRTGRGATPVKPHSR